MVPEEFKVMLSIIENINKKSHQYWEKIKGRQAENKNFFLKNQLGYRTIHPKANEIFDITNNKITFVREKEIPLCTIGAEPDYLPVFSFKCEKKYHNNKTQEFWYVSLRLGMIKNDEEIPKGFGFRFESGNPKSTHTYYHCQITPDPFRKDQSREIFKHFHGPPENNPCIVLPVKNPTTLILCFLFSIYGYNSSLWSTYQLNYTGIPEDDKKAILSFYNHNSFNLISVQ